MDHLPSSRSVNKVKHRFGFAKSLFNRLLVDSCFDAPIQHPVRLTRKASAKSRFQTHKSETDAMAIANSSIANPAKRSKQTKEVSMETSTSNNANDKIISKPKSRSEENLGSRLLRKYTEKLSTDRKRRQLNQKSPQQQFPSKNTNVTQAPLMSNNHGTRSATRASLMLNSHGTRSATRAPMVSKSHVRRSTTQAPLMSKSHGTRSKREEKKLMRKRSLQLSEFRFHPYHQTKIRRTGCKHEGFMMEMPVEHMQVDYCGDNTDIEMEMEENDHFDQMMDIDTPFQHTFRYFGNPFHK